VLSSSNQVACTRVFSKASALSTFEFWWRWDYQPGNFYPVAIADIFAEGCYRVVHKLGSGGSSTISLAREQGESGGLIRTIKVMRAEVSSNNWFQNWVLLCLFHPLSLVQSSDIQTPQDYFVEVGPNGSHLCLVYRLAGPSTLSMSFSPGSVAGSRRLQKELAKLKVAKQWLQLCPWSFVAIFVPEESLAADRTTHMLHRPTSCSTSLKMLQNGRIKNFISTSAKMDHTETLDYSPFGPHTPPQLIALIDNACFTSFAFLREDMLLIGFGNPSPVLPP